MKISYCAHCSKELDPETYFLFHDTHLCPECFDELTTRCSHCGEVIWTSANQGTDALPLCENCFEQHYTTCDDCGRILLNSDACYDSASSSSYCSDCYHALQRTDGIHDYYYKPRPLFYGNGPRFFGVELEVDGAGEDSCNARAVMEIANGNGEHAYCKHDGSLDDGFEIVTHPMSISYHTGKMPWCEILDRLKGMGYTSHQARTCGLHCHVSRVAFGVDKESQDAAIARILYFMEKHWEELLKFSRRTQRQLDRWAARYGYRDQPSDILDNAKKGAIGRYACVNLQCQDTIEFRIFRGTLKLNTLIATLQLVDRICDVALYLSDDEIKDLSWTTFVSGCTQPELVQYLKERRLYVNEPVESEVEI